MDFDTNKKKLVILMLYSLKTTEIEIPVRASPPG